VLGHPAVRVILSPVLLAQALAVRRRVPVLPEAAGARAGVSGQGPMLRLLIAGDSSAAGVGVAHQDQALAGRLVAALGSAYRVDWQLHATSGHTSRDALALLAALPVQGFDVAVTALGVNDVLRQVSPASFARRQADLARLLQDRFGVRLHLRAGVPPMERFPALPRPLRDVLGAQARSRDRALAAAATPTCLHLPFDAAALDPVAMAGDGFHPGPAIYRDWAEDLARRIRQRMGG
jgi:lysophospholipase L1-like esterase